MLYQIKDGTVSAGGQTILSHVDFYIKEKRKNSCSRQKRCWKDHAASASCWRADTGQG